MSIGTRLVLPSQVAFLGGVVAPNAYLWFYLTGSATPAITYANVGLTVQNTNPVQANGAGLFPEIFLDPTVTYKTVLTDSDGANGLTYDPVDSNTAALAAGLSLGTAAAEDIGTSGAVVPLLNANNQYDGNNVHNGLETFGGGGSLTPRSGAHATDLGYFGWPQKGPFGAGHAFVTADVGCNCVFTGAYAATIPLNLANDPLQLGVLLRATWTTGAGTLVPAAGVTLRWPNGNVTGTRTVTGPGFIVAEQMVLNEWWVIGGANIS